MHAHPGDGRGPVAAPIVLTLDYPGAGERSRLADLAGQAPGVELIPLLGGTLPRGLTAVSYAEELLDRWTAPDRRVGAVLTYCMAAPIGHEVARLVGAQQGWHPTFLAIDGSPCPAWFVAEVFRDMVRGPAPADPGSTGAEITEAQLREDSAGVVSRMERELTERATRNLIEEFGDGVVVADIVRNFTDLSMDWLTHLVAAHNAPFSPWDGQAILLASREAPFQDRWPGVRTSRTVRLDCAREDVIGHPDVRRHLLDALATRDEGGSRPARYGHEHR